MEANVYFFAALVSTGIFLLQFILSIFFGSMDTDIDVNADGNACLLYTSDAADE